MRSITCKCNRLQFQLLWNFMITNYNFNYFFLNVINYNYRLRYIVIMITLRLLLITFKWILFYLNTYYKIVILTKGRFSFVSFLHSDISKLHVQGPWKNFQEMLYRTTQLKMVNKRSDFLLSERCILILYFL